MWNFGKYKNRIAVIDDLDREVTYQKLEAQGDALAERLEKRCLVFIICTGTIGSLLGYTACLRYHIVPLMLAETIDPGLLENLIETYHPQFIWRPEEIQEEESEKCVYRSYGYSLMKTEYKEAPEFDENLALLLTTSGSTGSQKLVRISYENLESNTNSIVKYLEINQDERAVLALPMSYTYGLSIINTHLAAGGSLMLTTKKVIQKGFWNFFRQYKATSFSAVPHTYDVLDKMHFFQMELPSLRTMTQAGGKLSRNLQEQYGTYAKERGIRFVVMYGQTEATARISYLPYKECLNKTGSIGIAIPDGKLSIWDESGEEVKEPNVQGELVYKGKNVTLGYAKSMEDLKNGDERGGILRTGDMGYFDEDGYFYVCGRRDRYRKIYGNRVSLDEIENLVRTGLSIEETACVGIDEKVYIYVTETEKTEEIRQYLSKTMNLNKNVFHVRVLDAIPRNDSGKILYKKLNEAIL